ncbi:hypothetical protein ARMGADRAFT_1039310 [Armillaria gallica]|uniref:Uncharacterized protein n=1 Tax=Armillaria gallica TaxID=47427 RepID=A0A2H3CZJ5_ARMGA|nr:hypothetical protein ARMGADRAFT_1039310 [Armillaria gallica]
MTCNGDRDDEEDGQRLRSEVRYQRPAIEDTCDHCWVSGFNTRSGWGVVVGVFLGCKNGHTAEVNIRFVLHIVSHLTGLRQLVVIGTSNSQGPLLDDSFVTDGRRTRHVNQSDVHAVLRVTLRAHEDLTVPGLAIDGAVDRAEVSGIRTGEEDMRGPWITDQDDQSSSVEQAQGDGVVEIVTLQKAWSLRMRRRKLSDPRTMSSSLERPTCCHNVSMSSKRGHGVEMATDLWEAWSSYEVEDMEHKIRSQTLRTLDNNFALTKRVHMRRARARARDGVILPIYLTYTQENHLEVGKRYARVWWPKVNLRSGTKDHLLTFSDSKSLRSQRDGEGQKHRFLLEFECKMTRLGRKGRHFYTNMQDEMCAWKTRDPAGLSLLTGWNNGSNFKKYMSKADKQQYALEPSLAPAEEATDTTAWSLSTSRGDMFGTGQRVQWITNAKAYIAAMFVRIVYGSIDPSDGPRGTRRRIWIDSSVWGRERSMEEFAAANEVPLGLNGDHGCLEGWMKDIALALQGLFKSVRITDGRDWWKCVGPDIGGVSRFHAKSFHADACLIDADTCLSGADACLTDAKPIYANASVIEVWCFCEGYGSSILGANHDALPNQILPGLWDEMAILPLHTFEVISNLTLGMGMGGSEGGMGTYLQCSGPYLRAILGAVSLLFNGYGDVFLSKDFCHQFNEHLDVKNSHPLTELIRENALPEDGRIDHGTGKRKLKKDRRYSVDACGVDRTSPCGAPGFARDFIGVHGSTRMYIRLNWFTLVYTGVHPVKSSKSTCSSAAYSSLFLPQLEYAMCASKTDDNVSKRDGFLVLPYLFIVIFSDNVFSGRCNFAKLMLEWLDIATATSDHASELFDDDLSVPSPGYSGKEEESGAGTQLPLLDVSIGQEREDVAESTNMRCSHRHIDRPIPSPGPTRRILISDTRLSPRLKTRRPVSHAGLEFASMEMLGAKDGRRTEEGWTKGAFP